MEIKRFKVENFVCENMAFRLMPKDSTPIYVVTNERVRKNLNDGNRRVYSMIEIGELLKLQPEFHIAETIKGIFGHGATVREVKGLADT
ncbi:MAG: hypothetical protein GTN76_08920 [Candidatus Aenigmarchaeota archaeon]|nr:hypothetical protein [Candidatus Aenigmarchaeota archaeon]